MDKSNAYMLASFHTQSGAIKFEKQMKCFGHQCKLKPVPRKISSSCGICAVFFLEDFNDFISDDIEYIFKVKNQDYDIIYKNE